VSTPPRGALLIDLALLVDDDGHVSAGASALVVDCLRRGLPAAVFSTERDATAVLADTGLVAVLDAQTGPEAVGADAPTVVAGLGEQFGAPADGTVVLSPDMALLAAMEARGDHVVAVGLPGVPHQTVADVHLEEIEPLASDRVELDHGVALLDGWSVEMDRHEPDQVVTVGSNLMTGNGFLGYRGTAPEWDASAKVGCIVTGTWDAADGKWAELVSAPNALRVRWEHDGTSLDVPHDGPLDVRAQHHRRLDLLLGRTDRRVDHPDGLTVHDERFASLDELGLVAQRHRVTGPVGTRLTVRLAVDGEVWDLNGPHLPDLRFAVDGAGPGEVVVVDGRTVQSQVHVAVAQSVRLRTGQLHDATVARSGDVVERTWEVEITSADGVVIDVFMGVAHDNGSPHAVHADDPVREARRIVSTAHDTGYAPLLARQLVDWRAVWEGSDVAVVGDPVTQASLRFGTYHNVIATPRHDPTLPIGARGLSCQAYQGAAFWDQEVFNLPMYLHTQPEVARGVLGYRIATLDGARRKAASLGHAGAFFAWISGETGDELCPDFFFADVMTGRPIRNHFNDWQMHVAPDIALTFERYVQVTGDRSILADGGAELVFDVARFLDDFVWHDPLEDSYHCLRLLGPDEWHENVDDNAFTNHQVRAALDLAVRWWDEVDEPVRASWSRAERDRWARVVERLHLPLPDPATGVIEQFRGFHDLEDVRPDEVATRVADPDEYWGWPNGVAVHTQVSKQADVAQLFVTQPGLFDDEVVEANVDHYLPRTAHGSSLSRGVYALTLARLGRTDEARELFLRSATIDLLSRRNDAPGGTFIGGIRTAAAGMSWQVVVLGFCGLGVDGDRCTIDPHLPAGWSSVTFAATHRGVRYEATVTPDRVEVEVAHDAPTALALRAGGADHDVAAGERVQVALG
jgi:kojibiose phosphorylase